MLVPLILDFVFFLLLFDSPFFTFINCLFNSLLVCHSSKIFTFFCCNYLICFLILSSLSFVELVCVTVREIIFTLYQYCAMKHKHWHTNAQWSKFEKNDIIQCLVSVSVSNSHESDTRQFNQKCRCYIGIVYITYVRGVTVLKGVYVLIKRNNVYKEMDGYLIFLSQGIDLLWFIYLKVLFCFVVLLLTRTEIVWKLYLLWSLDMMGKDQSFVQFFETVENLQY